MGFWSFFTLLCLVGFYVNWYGTTKALRINSNIEKGPKLPSLPQYYGRFTFLWFVIPTLAIFLIWIITKPFLIDHLVQQQIPVGNITAQPIAAAPTPAAPATVPPIQESAPAIKEEDSNLITVKAQMIGTFYRSPGPDKDSFVEVGSVIKPGDKLCIIEAMKLFNEIESDVSGKIVKVLAEDQSPVEFDQPLFLVDPS